MLLLTVQFPCENHNQLCQLKKNIKESIKVEVQIEVMTYFGITYIGTVVAE